MATLARMQVDLIARSGQYQREMRRATVSTDTLRTGMHRLRTAALFLTGATGFGLLAKRTFELGSAVEETGSKFRTVFGDSTEQVDQFLGSWARIAGLSQTQAREVTATTGAIVQGMGLSQRASADYAEAVVRLAGDLSSFNNVPIAETSRAIQAAITGERESLKRLGVVILETDVQQRALLNTGLESVKMLTQEQKALATLQLVTERAGVAIGDLDRTQESAANRARRLAADFRDIREAIASALLPVFSVVMDHIEDMLGGTATFVEWLKTSAPVMTAWAEVGVAAFGAVGNALRATVDITLAFGRLMESTFAAIFAAFNPRGDWQTFHALAREIDQSWADMGESFVSVGDRMIEVYDRVRIAMETFNEATVTFVRPALDRTTQGADAAATALDRLNDALNKYNAASSLLGGISRIPGLGFLGGLSNVAGIVGGIVNPLAGLAGAFGLFGGGKASGGPVSGGTAYVVGERGPEMFVPSQSGTIVPNGGLSVNVSMTAPRNGSEALRDREWLRALQMGADALKTNGYSFA